MLRLNHIRVARHSSPHPSSRVGAVYLFRSAKKKAFWAKLFGGTFVFDFQGVGFTSRSYTDQFLNEIEQWEAEGIKVKTINQIPIVQEMFQTVAANKQKTRETDFEVSYHRVETMEELADYLKTI